MNRNKAKVWAKEVVDADEWTKILESNKNNNIVLAIEIYSGWFGPCDVYVPVIDKLMSSLAQQNNQDENIQWYRINIANLEKENNGEKLSLLDEWSGYEYPQPLFVFIQNKQILSVLRECHSGKMETTINNSLKGEKTEWTVNNKDPADNQNKNETETENTNTKSEIETETECNENKNNQNQSQNNTDTKAIENVDENQQNEKNKELQPEKMEDDENNKDIKDKDKDKENTEQEQKEDKNNMNETKIEVENKDKNEDKMKMDIEKEEVNKNNDNDDKNKLKEEKESNSPNATKEENKTE